MAEPKVSVGVTDSKFLKVVQHFLKTPPKPHKEMKHKGDKKQGDGRRRADRKK